MAFEILNEAASVVYVLAGENRYPQAEPDKVDFDILAQGIDGEGVVSGGAVTPQGAPDTTVAVAAAVVRIAGVDVAYAGGNVNCGAADLALPRFDLIIINNVGVPSAVAGVAALVPDFPGAAAVPATSVVIAAVWRAANDNTITAADIVDKRCDLISELEAKSTELIDGNDEIAVPTTSWVYLNAGGAADNLLGIVAGREGQRVFLTPTAGKDITLIHNSGATVAGQPLMINGEANVLLDEDHDMAIAVYDSVAAVWNVLVPGAGGVGAHNLLNGVTHPDTVLQGATRGSMVLGNATPAWDELTVGPVNSVLTANALDAAWDDTPTVETMTLAANAGGAETMLTVSPTTAGVTDWRGIELSPILTNAGNNRSMKGLIGNASANIAAGTVGHTLIGLDFLALVACSNLNNTQGVSVLYGAQARGQSAVIQFGAGVTVLNITDQKGFHAAAPNITNSGILGGTATTNITSLAAFEAGSMAYSLTGLTIAAAYGLRLWDISGTSVTNGYLIEAGPLTPHMRLEATATWAPGANTSETALLLLAGNNDNPLTETLRRVEWKDGAAIGGGDMVMVLV